MAMCRSWRTWAALAGVTLVVALLAPGGRATLVPLVVVAACPLSMVVMAAGMAAAGRREMSDRGRTPAEPRERVLR